MDKFNKRLLSACVAAAIVGTAGNAIADRRDDKESDGLLFDYLAQLGKSSKNDGDYLAGDFHNHTTCSDGSTSVRTLTRKSLTYLDWFIHVGHSGSGSRDCRIDDFLYLNRGSGDNGGLWVNSLPGGADDIKGDVTEETMGNGDVVQRMWRWQSLQEFNLGGIVEEREKPGNEDKTAFLGLEWVVPGHEHASNSISTGQFEDIPNSDALAQFEYCFAVNSNDTSQGGGQGWTCELSEESNQKLIELFQGRPEEGTADYNSTLVGGINTDDAGEHVKSAAAMLWMQDNFPGQSFSAQAHVERQGAYIPDDDEGYNIEHIRDWNSLVPDVAFGFESQPGHQAVRDRGSYNAGRPSSGLWTYGGTGCYAGAEAAKPGLDFDGNALDTAMFPDLGIPADMDPAKVVLCRPGVRTMWDAMLSEGRHFWFVASSDWHSRGEFGPLDYESTTDFWPGEYQKQITWIENNNPQDPAQDIVDGLRSGNTYSVQGQLIDKLYFIACSRRKCATMGETLEVRKGERVRVKLVVRDPDGPNNSPYKFNNPSLLQIGVERPLNEPKVAQVDLITGVVTGLIAPTAADYYNPLAPETTRIAATWDERKLGKRPVKVLSYDARVDKDMYVRVRGTNIPAGTSNERDMFGNPLADNLSDNIPCTDPACPPHINGYLDADVEAWADLWFYSNPIFIDVK